MAAISLAMPSLLPYPPWNHQNVHGRASIGGVANSSLKSEGAAATNELLKMTAETHAERSGWSQRAAQPRLVASFVIFILISCGILIADAVTSYRQYVLLRVDL